MNKTPSLRRLRGLMASILAALAPLVISIDTHAEITGVIIDRRTPLIADDGHSVSGYEKIRGRLIGEVDPRLGQNAVIQDIELAPVDAQGHVQYVTTFTLHRPLESSRSARLLLDILPNRGHRYGTDAAYYARGYSMIWIGWQGDLPEAPSAEASAEGLALESVSVPRARRQDGRPILGRYLIRVPTLGAEGPTGPLMRLDQGSAGPLAYFPANYDTRRATLTGGPAETIRGQSTGGRYIIDHTEWRWWNCRKNAGPQTAQVPAQLCLRRLVGAFSPSQTYELTFTARDPLILALGLAATRDAVSFFRYADGRVGDRVNPLAGQIDHVVGQGTSQSGNLVKTFIALGFNQDEHGRIVWDGANAHVAGRLAPVNYRFATPGSSPTLFMPGSEGVLWWGSAVDALRGGPPRSLLDRCAASHTCPKIFETFGGTEFWNQRITPGLVNFDLKRDIPLPANVRRYYFPGTGHGGGRGGFALLEPELAATPGIPGSEIPACTLQINPNPERDQMRALTIALVDWISVGTAPPESRFPSRMAGELVLDTDRAYHFPKLPHVPRPMGLANPLLIYDYGQEFNYVDMSGVITLEPPRIKGVVPALVPQVDSDGNETSGAPSVQHAAPLGTYLSWNTQRDNRSGRSLCSYTGGFVPFAKTRSEREKSGDLRPSIEERYESRQGYICAVREAAQHAVSARFLLAEDAQQLVDEATAAVSTGSLSFLPAIHDARTQALCTGSRTQRPASPQ